MCPGTSKLAGATSTLERWDPERFSCLPRSQMRRAWALGRASWGTPWGNDCSALLLRIYVLLGRGVLGKLANLNLEMQTVLFFCFFLIIESCKYI